MVSASLGAMSVAQAQETIIVEEGQAVGPQYGRRLYNYGEIDGDAARAVGVNGGYQDSAFLQNDGLIHNNAWLPTVQPGGPYSSIVNSGTIRNDGTGAAILTAAFFLNTNIINTKTGVIDGVTAISAAPLFPYEFGSFSIINAGTIRGDIIGYRSDDFIRMSDVDTGEPGFLDGNIFLDWGDDVLDGVAIDPVTGLISNITGSIDGGEGHDVIGLTFAGDTMVGAFQMPTNFEELKIAAAQGQTITLGSGYTAGGFTAVGAGTIDIRSTITEDGPVIRSDMGQTAIINDGTLISTSTDRSVVAVQLSGFSTFTNNGTLTANAGTAVQDSYYTTIINNGAIRSAAGEPAVYMTGYGNTLENAGSISGAATGVRVNGGSYSQTVIRNSGDISAGVGIELAGSADVYNEASGRISGTSAAIWRTNASASGFRIFNAGVVDGNIDLMSGDDAGGSFDLYTVQGDGVVTGSIALGLGDDRIEVGDGAFASPIALGRIHGGGGVDTLAYVASTSQTVNVPASLEDFERIELTANAADATLIVNGGVAGMQAVTSGAGAVTFSSGASITGGASLQANATLTSNAGHIAVSTSDQAVLLGLGAIMENSGTIANSEGAAIGVASPFYSAARPVVRNLAGGIIEGRDTAVRLLGVCDGCPPAARVEIDNAGTIRGAVDLRSTFPLSSAYSGSGMIVGDLLFGEGFDEVTLKNGALIDGRVEMGIGDDFFTAEVGSRVIGVIDGGDGQDRLALRGDVVAADALTLDQYRNFEVADLEGGYWQVRRAASFEEIVLRSGRLVGAAGSVFDAGDVSVLEGAIFGSAGTVNGDVTVLGTLSPGASPGTMTINGGLALGTGSNTLFEMTPTVSDAIIVNGALSIASGATLTLTGERPLMPGTIYNLITASDGISGRFSTIAQADGVEGFVVQQAASIQLLGQFAFDPEAAVDPQAERASDYLNGILVRGGASEGLVSAVPTFLQANGYADAGRMRLLTPEVYASASQIGVETGLSLSTAARSIRLADRLRAGLFGFGQGFGSGRDLPRRGALGTAKADMSTRGALGGVGYGAENASIGAFIGYVDAHQRIGALGARTESDGMIAGVIGKAVFDGVEIGVMVAYDGSKAATRRSLPDATTATSHYGARSWTTDARVGYAFDVGSGWELKPEAGFTFIGNKRQATKESGGSPLLLDVDGRRTKAMFFNGGLTLRGNADALIQPWLSAGVRHQTSGRAVVATGSLTGLTTAFGAPGASRDRTQATVSAGLGAALSPMATLFFGASGDFGGNSTGKSANAGLKIGF